MKRRNFIATSGLAALSSLAPSRRATPAPAVPLDQRICVFTDHLDHIPGITYEDIGRMFAELGVAGPDLTVRPGGVIEPERVAEDLPKAARVFADHGLTIPMITTAITSRADVGDILVTAKEVGIDYYRLGYMRYEDMERWRQRRERARENLAGLVELGRSIGIHAGFHNHSGPIVGGTLWDCLDLVEPLDQRWLGVFFDIAHATIEGGKFGWEIGFHRARPSVTMAVVKDYVWEKVDGKWRTRWVPLGQGMVPFDDYMPLLVQTDFPGPLSLHIEYDPGGDTKTQQLERAHEAAARDLEFLRGQLRKAVERS
jgi:L-ribulose-5-phosphate 3-epimerase